MSHKKAPELFCIKKADCLCEINPGKIGKMKQVPHFSQLIRHHNGFYHDLIRYPVFSEI